MLKVNVSKFQQQQKTFFLKENTSLDIFLLIKKLHIWNKMFSKSVVDGFKENVSFSLFYNDADVVIIFKALYWKTG